MKKKTAIFLVFCLGMVLFYGICSASVYKYKDADGNWHFTDTPPEAEEAEVEEVRGIVGQTSGLEDLEKKLMDKYQPNHAVEKSSLATVTVKTPVSQGSGFFISEDGYLITNKHVVKVDEGRMDETRERIRDADKKVERIEENFETEEASLKHSKKRLEAYKQSIDKIRDPARRKLEEERYQIEMKKYESWKADFHERKAAFRTGKLDYDRQKSDYNYKTQQARMSRNFTLILKDGTELDAHLVAVSSDHDLALLKLDRYKTPRLAPGDSRQVAQGMKVFAVGSPLGLRDSVSAGVMSGFSQGYIKTDARIYPGNSGGPLINEEGEVIGINTMLRVAYGMDGIGLGIPIEIAVREFGYAFSK